MGDLWILKSAMKPWPILTLRMTLFSVLRPHPWCDPQFLRLVLRCPRVIERRGSHKNVKITTMWPMGDLKRWHLSPVDIFLTWDPSQRQMVGSLSSGYFFWHEIPLKGKWLGLLLCPEADNIGGLIHWYSKQGWGQTCWDRGHQAMRGLWRFSLQSPNAYKKESSEMRMLFWFLHQSLQPDDLSLAACCCRSMLEL